METIKQIVYREDDGVLMIVANNEDLSQIPRFIADLSAADRQVIEDLRTFVLTKVADIKYLVYTAEGNTLDLESETEELVRLEVADLGDDKPIVDAVGLLCTQLLNS